MFVFNLLNVKVITISFELLFQTKEKTEIKYDTDAIEA